MRSFSISFLRLACRSRDPLSSLASRSTHHPLWPPPPPRSGPAPWIRSVSIAREPTERVSAIVDEISRLTLLEVSDLAEVLRTRLGVEEMPIMAVMAPGMGPPSAQGKGGAAGGAAEEVETKEKTAFDLRLESFDAAAKIKVIKEVRSFTELGLKEAKELVEKAPAVLKQGVLREEAEKIVEKMKAVGAKVVLE